MNILIHISYSYEYEKFTSIIFACKFTFYTVEHTNVN